MSSPVWQYFTINLIDSLGVTCKLCQTTYSRGTVRIKSSYNTTNSRKHLEPCHNDANLTASVIFYLLLKLNKRLHHRATAASEHFFDLYAVFPADDRNGDAQRLHIVLDLRLLI